jgi:hypothetical protein
MIGNIREEDKVLKLWKGFRAEVQQGLWRDKLNPDLNSWDEVLTQAERIEMSIKTASSHSGKRPSNATSNVGGPHNGPGSSTNTMNSRSSLPRHLQFKNTGHKPASSSTQNGSNHRFGNKNQPNKFGFKKHSQTPDTSKPKAANAFPNRNDRESNKAPVKHSTTGELQCYNCGEYGHISQNCPRGNTVNNNGKKPPGNSNFNVEIMAAQPESNSIEEVEVLDSLPLGAISF